MPVRRLFGFVTLAAACALLPAPSGTAQSSPNHSPRYSGDRLEFPADYREWVFLSSGKGMTYGPASDPNGAPQFDNVFVPPEVYREFQKTGRWPDPAMFVLEIRKAQTQGSINKAGQFQSDLQAIEIEVKDTKRFTETSGWAFFEFGTKREPVSAAAKNASCHTCHSANAAVEHTFVQFYPTLIDVARTNGTFRDIGK